MIDPTRDELLEWLRDCADDILDLRGEEVEFDIEEAAYWIAADCHGGQWSNLYAALCASPYSPGQLACGPMEGEPAWFLHEIGCRWLCGTDASAEVE